MSHLLIYQVKPCQLTIVRALLALSKDRRFLMSSGMVRLQSARLAGDDAPNL